MLEQSTEPGEAGGRGIRFDGRREISADDEVRALSLADLLRDHTTDDIGVFVVGNVERGVLQGNRSGRQLVEGVVQRDHVV